MFIWGFDALLWGCHGSWAAWQEGAGIGGGKVGTALVISVCEIAVSMLSYCFVCHHHHHHY